MMTSNYIFEAGLALKAASTSSEMIEERFAEGMVFSTKGTYRDIVTDLDLIIESHIIEILKCSQYKIIGEETLSTDNLYTPPKELTWFIDPIDGTTNLVSSIPYYATSIGLICDSQFLVGAVAIPTLKEIFFTFGDQGSFLNGKNQRVKPIELKNSLISVGFSGDYHDKNIRNLEYELFGFLNDNSRGCLRLGAASINICYVAANRFQAAYGISNKIWDVAGALAIAQQAGCNIYIEWLCGTTEINYVVGAPGVADEIAALLNSNNSFNLRLISQDY
ncbi:inositol monophosphatase family protein [Methanospirillum sp.]